MDMIFEGLKRIPLLKRLPKPLLNEISGKLQKHSLGKNEYLFRQGSSGDSLYLISKGTVRVFIENDLQEDLTLVLFGPGEFIGEMALLDKKTRSASVIAIDQVELYELKRDDFLDILSREPVLAVEMMQTIVERLRFTSIYLGKSMEWNLHVARGDYNSAIEQINSIKPLVSDIAASDMKSAERYISTFFQMIEGVKQREDALKDSVNRLQIEIDEAKRECQVSEITGTEYFVRLKGTVQKLKKQRQSQNY